MTPNDEEKPKKLTPGDIEPGMRFGHWTVVKFSHVNKHRIKYFLCRCDCGTERAIRGTALIEGTSRACSRQCENDLTGQQFGYWTVLHRDRSRTRYHWCRCVCGTERSVYDGSLKNGTTKSCGCRGRGYKASKRNPQDNVEVREKYESYVGKKIGMLQVLSLNYAGGYYICQCDCGKTVKVQKYNLISGNTTSCGCKRAKTYRENKEKEYRRLIGQKINHITVLDCYYKNNSFWFKCKCDCGKEFDALATKVATEYLQSCGCLKSKAEEDMAKILDAKGISYKREYRLSDCCDKQPLPFDFAIFNEADELVGLMELNGKQHYTTGGWQTKAALEYIQKRDKIKIRYCVQENIPLLVIPYQYYDELEKFLTTSDFWQMITKNFND